MRNLLLLLKLRLNEQLGLSANKNEKNKLKKTLGYVRRIVILALAVILVMLITAAAKVLCQVGFTEVLPTLAYMLTSIITLMITIFKMNELITGNADAEFVLAMPFGDMTPAFVIFFLLYLENTLIAALIEIPVYLVYNGVAENPIGIGYFVIGLLFSVMPASGIAALIGIILILILSTSEHSNLIQSMISIIVLLGAVSLVLYIMVTLGNMYLAADRTINTAVSEKMLKVITGNYKLAGFYQGGIVAQYGAGTLAYAAISALWFGFFILIIGVTYREVVAAMKCPVKYRTYEWQPQKAMPLGKSLFRRELAQYFRSKAYMKYTLFFLLLGVVFGALLLIVTPGKLLRIFNAEMLYYTKLERAVPLILCIFAALGSTTYCSLTMEGRRHWILDIIPFEEDMIYGQKMKLSLMIGLPISFLSAILCILAFRPSTLLLVVYIVLPAVYVGLCAKYGIFINRKFVDYTITNESQAMYGSISFFLGCLPTVVLPVIATLLVLFL